jgi:CubicO group peptidase (beta-lactamase class C family)
MNVNNYTTFLDSLLNEGIPSFDCYIFKNHEQIYHHMGGFTDGEGTKKIDGTELYLMFSMTKVITMTAVLQLVEQGVLSLEDPVHKYLPKYKNLTVEKDGNPVPAKNELKLKHLLSMQSGLDYNLERGGIARVLGEKGMQASTKEIVEAFIESPLLFEPGSHFEYSLSHDVAAAVVEVASGMRFSEYLKKNILEPIGMNHTSIAKLMNHDDHLATQFVYDDNTHTSTPMEPSCVYQFSDNYESGGAGLMSCAIDYAKFADTIASGGVTVDGKQILKPETIDLMRTNLLGKEQLMDLEGKMGRIGYGYGCGVQVLLDPKRAESVAPEGIFGWDGAAGSAIIMDPENKLSIVYIQHVRNCGYSYSYIHPRLRDMLYE